ncbi:dolichyl-phosphate beta-glucosyltransferase-like isoform X2 [Arvicola amphibius]|uniref:dolichyl-phosphate beta-glucosyltransferase-like isoform X2 n=1 Tax=Arvicola amphibius TaxID=1047088 RepID=UPI001C092199|nr:dolichyl-phosphate beta-glucosyltransferase-like isoform X2 [Arvicola amphibius]
MPTCHQYEEKFFLKCQRPEGNFTQHLGLTYQTALFSCLPTRKRNLPVMMDEALNYLEQRQTLWIPYGRPHLAAMKMRGGRGEAGVGGRRREGKLWLAWKKNNT